MKRWSGRSGSNPVAMRVVHSSLLSLEMVQFHYGHRPKTSRSPALPDTGKAQDKSSAQPQPSSQNSMPPPIDELDPFPAD